MLWLNSDCKWIQFSPTCEDNFVISSRSVGSEESILRCNWKEKYDSWIFNLRKLKFCLFWIQHFLPRNFRRHYYSEYFFLKSWFITISHFSLLYHFFIIIIMSPLWYCHYCLRRTEAVTSLLSLRTFQIPIQKQAHSPNTKSIFLCFSKFLCPLQPSGNECQMGPWLYFLKI